MRIRKILEAADNNLYHKLDLDDLDDFNDLKVKAEEITEGEQKKLAEMAESVGLKWVGLDKTRLPWQIKNKVSNHYIISESAFASDTFKFQGDRVREESEAHLTVSFAKLEDDWWLITVIGTEVDPEFSVWDMFLLSYKCDDLGGLKKALSVPVVEVINRMQALEDEYEDLVRLENKIERMSRRITEDLPE